MLVRSLKGTDYEIQDNAVARVLLDARLCTEVKPPTPIIPPTTWRVDISVQGKAALRAECKRCASGFSYSGKKVSEAVFAHCGKSEKPPLEVTQAFRVACAQSEPDKSAMVGHSPLDERRKLIQQAAGSGRDRETVSYSPGDPGGI